MPRDETYSGPVCYQDGWHWSTTIDENGHEVPDQQLYLDETSGAYRFAADDDQSWHDRHHQQFVTVVLEDGAAAERVTPEEMQAIQQLLGQIRGGQ